MKEPKDKRTKEYKEWKKLQEIEVIEPEYLGDKVEKLIKKVVPKKILDKIEDEDCGCGKRKEALNKYSKAFLDKFTTRRQPIRCLTAEQHKSYGQFIKTRSLNIWKPSDIDLLTSLYAHVFAKRIDKRDLCINCGNSGKILFRITEELDKVYEDYDN